MRIEAGPGGDRRVDPPRHDIAYHPLRLLLAAMAEEGARCDPPVVDLGCGSKPYRDLFASPYHGVDVRSAHGEPDAVGAAERAPVRSGSCATALSTQNLEHVDDPGAVLAEARRVLRPGGTLVLSTHGVWVHHPDPHDRWRWTEEGLVELVAAHGFEVERVHRLGESLLAGAILAGYPLAHLSRRAGTTGVAARAAVRALNAIAGPADRALAARAPRHLASVGYVVVARAVADT